jgi:hypothetical protein
LCRKHRVYIFHVQAIQTKVSTWNWSYKWWTRNKFVQETGDISFMCRLGLPCYQWLIQMKRGNEAIGSKVDV